MIAKRMQKSSNMKNLHYFLGKINSFFGCVILSFMSTLDLFYFSDQLFLHNAILESVADFLKSRFEK